MRSPRAASASSRAPQERSTSSWCGDTYRLSQGARAWRSTARVIGDGVVGLPTRAWARGYRHSAPRKVRMVYPRPSPLSAERILLAALLAFPLAACQRHETPATAERAVLERRQRGLAALAAAARKGSLVPFHDLLVVADEGLVRGVIAGSLPFERVISDRYRVRVTGAEVHF